ncbi:MAG: guanylate kinase [Chromatiales bacterium]|nr:guanylate kinase [Chromatiales bacterium]
MNRGAPSGHAFVITAPSGAGKTSLIDALMQRLPGLERGISYTTRAPGPGEVDGRDYHFVTDARFDELFVTGALLESTAAYGNRYGTGRDALATQLARADVLLALDRHGALALRAALSELVRTIFVVPPSAQALRARLRARGRDDDQSVERRLAAAAAELRGWREFDYVVVNDDFEQAVEELATIVSAARCERVARSGLIADIEAGF